jgi:hypothetical protein
MKNNIKIDSIEKIKGALIEACILSRSSYFKPYLVLEKVICEPDNESFYKLFKYMLAVSKKTSDGELFLKKRFPNTENKNVGSSSLAKTHSCPSSCSAL